ncbi:MAG: homoserine kinase [Candidatus Sericytochromatia bacterium]|nr:homoserine kinase [Candidatus Sericytochromatia bacterium]
MNVRVPATSANLGPGFDVLGLALPLYNDLHLSHAEREHVVHTGPWASALSVESDHLSLQAARRVAALVGRALPPMRWDVTVRIPPARGLGSSSAAIVGGLVAANLLFDTPLSTSQLLMLATDMEGHPDNVAPALHGGVTAAFKDGADTWCLPLATAVPGSLVVAIPDFSLSTAEARQVLPVSVDRQAAIANLAAVTALTSVILTGNVSWWGRALKDQLHQPYRLPLIPGGTEVLEAAREAGAWGAVISGAGPTLLAVCPPDRAATIAAAMRDTWRPHGNVITHTFNQLAAGAAPCEPSRG